MLSQQNKTKPQAFIFCAIAEGIQIDNEPISNDENLLLQGSICRDAFLGRSPRTRTLSYKALQTQISSVSFRLIPLKHPAVQAITMWGKKCLHFFYLMQIVLKRLFFLLNSAKIT